MIAPNMKGCRPLTDGEIARTLTAFRGRHAARERAWFTLGCKSGYRIRELLSLRLGDVLHADGTVADRITVRRRHMKRRREGRTVPLHPAARDALTVWLAEAMGPGPPAPNDPDMPLFPSRNRTGGTDGLPLFGERPSGAAPRPISPRQAGRVLLAAFRRAGVHGQLGTHCMRKTFAERIHRALGSDLVKTQRALGHRSIASTLSYLSFREEEIEDAILSI